MRGAFFYALLIQVTKLCCTVGIVSKGRVLYNRNGMDQNKTP